MFWRLLKYNEIVIFQIEVSSFCFAHLGIIRTISNLQKMKSNLGWVQRRLPGAKPKLELVVQECTCISLPTLQLAHTVSCSSPYSLLGTLDAFSEGKSQANTCFTITSFGEVKPRGTSF